MGRTKRPKNDTPEEVRLFIIERLESILARRGLGHLELKFLLVGLAWRASLSGLPMPDQLRELIPSPATGLPAVDSSFVLPTPQPKTEEVKKVPIGSL